MNAKSEPIDDFLSGHRLPGSFRRIIDDTYAPLAAWLAERVAGQRPLLLGINGAQGTGKSTLADFLKTTLEVEQGLRIAVLSLDDFYLSRADREKIGVEVHAMLATRGVPGTHDVKMLASCLERLRTLPADDRLRVPRFDKAVDDRADESAWPTIDGPLDLIILEGWCVGSVAESDAELERPVNALERDEDPDGTWRRYVNDRLGRDYEPLFSQLDALVFLAAPDFESVYRWRLEQEQKLAATASDTSAVMTPAQVSRFIQFYERITRANLRLLPDVADVVIELDRDHNCRSCHYRG